MNDSIEQDETRDAARREGWWRRLSGGLKRTSASIGGAISDTGLASTLAVGTTAITASLAGVTSPDDSLDVTPAQLVSIAVSPSNPFLTVGTTQQFTATGVYTDGPRDLTGSVTWAITWPGRSELMAVTRAAEMMLPAFTSQGLSAGCRGLVR